MPESIEPVRAHQRYGARGALRAAVVAVLQEHAPAWLASENLEALVCLRLGLSKRGLNTLWLDGEAMSTIA